MEVIIFSPNSGTSHNYITCIASHCPEGFKFRKYQKETAKLFMYPHQALHCMIGEEGLGTPACSRHTGRCSPPPPGQGQVQT